MPSRISGGRVGSTRYSFPNVEPWTNANRTIFAGLLEQFAASEPLPCEGVVYLWGLDAPPIEDLTLASLKSGSETICRGALALVQALAETRTASPRGGQALVCNRKRAKNREPRPAC